MKTEDNLIRDASLATLVVVLALGSIFTIVCVVPFHFDPKAMGRREEKYFDFKIHVLKYGEF